MSPTYITHLILTKVNSNGKYYTHGTDKEKKEKGNNKTHTPNAKGHQEEVTVTGPRAVRGSSSMPLSLKCTFVHCFHTRFFFKDMALRE